MLATGQGAHGAEKFSRVGYYALSCVLHLFFFFGLHGDRTVDERPLFQLPAEVEFGMSEPVHTGESGPSAAPPPAAVKAVPKSRPKARKLAAKADSISLPVDAGVAHPSTGGPDAGPSDASVVASAHKLDGGLEDEISGEGIVPGAMGDGLGNGLGGDGDGNGTGAAKGATIAMNVDLDRVRKSALLLEAHALLGIVPEWEQVLAGSGIDPVNDLQRVFVATPNLKRASLVVAARHALGASGIEAAVAKLAAARGEPATWRKQHGVAVAAWPNRGPTRRVIALTADDQFTITRQEDLRRVLAVARAMAKARARQGFAQEELNKAGGLLAMQPDEAVALWVEGLRRYVPSVGALAPLAVRMSVHRIDEFHTELRATGRYESAESAQAGLGYLDGMRKELSNHPRVIYLGLKSAVDQATLEQDKETLVLRVVLTLHQTRYLLEYLGRALHPRDDPAALAGSTESSTAPPP